MFLHAWGLKNRYDWGTWHCFACCRCESSKTSRYVDLFQLRTRISLHTSQSFYFHHNVLGWNIDFFFFSEFFYQKMYILSLLSYNELHFECSFYSLFSLTNVQKTNINILLHTLSFSIFKSENNLQYNFHIIHVLKLFVCNVNTIQVNRKSRRQTFITSNFVSLPSTFCKRNWKGTWRHAHLQSNFGTV